MQNPNSSVDSSMNPHLLGLFQNLYFHSNGCDDDNRNNNGYENGDHVGRTAMASSSSSLPANLYTNLISQPRIFNSPMRPLQRILLPNLQPLPGLVNDEQANFQTPIHENGHDAGVSAVEPNPDSDRTVYMLKSLGLFGMMTCEQGLVEFPKLLNRLNENSLKLVGNRVTSDGETFLGLAIHPYGSSALRTLLKRSSYVDQRMLIAVHDNFTSLMTSKYGQYIVIPTLRAVNKHKRTVLYAMAEAHALQLACHEIGCAALNEFLKEVRGEYRDRTMDIIAANALWLAQDQYGNFVVQHILSLQNPIFTVKIGQLLYGNYVHLSSQRLGSYVVEKCLKSSWAMGYVLDELIQSDELVRLAKNEFGNYVVQCALKTAKGQGLGLYEELVNKLKPHFGELQRGFGKNTLKLIEMLDQQQ